MMRTSLPSSNALVSSHWKASDPVVQGRDVRPSAPISAFEDEIWDLSCIVFRQNAYKYESRIDFGKIDDPVRRITAKELVMQRLNRPIQPAKRSKRPAKITAFTASLLVYSLKRVWRFMDSVGVQRIQDLHQDHLDAFYRQLASSGVGEKYQAGMLNTLVALYESRDWLTYDHLPFLPWSGRPLLDVVGFQKDEENTTARIPETVMGPLLRWSLAYVNLFSDDIIAALEAARPSDASENAPKTEGYGNAAKLREWLEGLRRHGRPLPGQGRANRKGVNFAAVGRILGLSAPSVQYYKAMLVEASHELGLSASAGLAEVSTPPGADIPWRPPFDVWALQAETRHLVAACYIVCAYLSGMRDSEVQDLRRGCYSPVLDEHGAVMRHKVSGLTYKGTDEQGEIRSWIVIEPVAKAIETLDRLTKDFALETGSDLLMVNVHNRRESASIKGSINLRLRAFQKHINAEVAPRLPGLGIGPIPPGPDGDPWLITTRQFRRTVAWHIANRPFGIVAGMIQYGHASEITFEGYAGSSQSGFRAEVETERALARQADIVEMYEDHKRGIEPAGPMAGELSTEFEHVRNELDDFPGKVVDEARRAKMLRHLRIRLFPGLLADCFFVPEEARCLRHLRVTERQEPVAGLCDPHCANACWAKKHLKVWEHTLRDTVQLGRRNQISPIQRTVLQNKAAECKAVITAIKDASHVDQT